MFSFNSASVSPWLITAGISVRRPTYQPSSIQYSKVNCFITRQCYPRAASERSGKTMIANRKTQPVAGLCTASPNTSEFIVHHPVLVLGVRDAFAVLAVHHQVQVFLRNLPDEVGQRIGDFDHIKPPRASRQELRGSTQGHPRRTVAHRRRCHRDHHPKTVGFQQTNRADRPDLLLGHSSPVRPARCDDV